IASATAAGCFRSSTTTRLPRRSGLSLLPPRRSFTAPFCGRAITVTSAPMSASMRPASGPGPMPSNSTTRMPVSGGIMRPSCKQLSSDQVLHDLGRAAVDARHARIGVEPRDRVLGHVAVAAEELQALVGDLALL